MLKPKHDALPPTTQDACTPVDSIYRTVPHALFS